MINLHLLGITHVNINSLIKKHVTINSMCKHFNNCITNNH